MHPVRVVDGRGRPARGVEGGGGAKLVDGRAGGETEPQPVVRRGVRDLDPEIHPVDARCDARLDPEHRARRQRPHHVQALDARWMAHATRRDRHHRIAGIVGHRVEVVRVTVVLDVLDAGEPGELAFTETDAQCAVVVGDHRDRAGRDLATVVFLVGTRRRRGEVDPAPAEGGDVGDDELHVERRKVLEHPYARGIVGADDAHRSAVDGVARDRRRRDGERVDVLGDVGHEEHREPVERDAHDVGAGERRRVEHRVLELGGARHPAFRAEPGEPLEGALRRLVRELGAAGEAGVHLAVHLVLRAAADGVVRVVLEQRAPRRVERRALVRGAERVTERGPRLGPAEQRLLGAPVGELEVEPGRPHARQQVGCARAEQLTGECGAVARVDRVHQVVEQSAHDHATGPLRQRRRDLPGVVVGEHVVDAVHEQRRRALDRPETVEHPEQPVDRLLGVAREHRGGEVAASQLVREHPAAVGREPAVDGADAVELVAVAPPVDHRPEPEPGEELRELGGVPERVGHVRDAGAAPDRLGDAPPHQQVADERLAGRQQGIGLHVPGADGQPPGPHHSFELVTTTRPHREVVLDHDRLPVEQERPTRIDREQVEHAVDGVDQPRPERLERPVPLAVPVRVRHQQDVDRPIRHVPESGRDLRSVSASAPAVDQPITARSSSSGGSASRPSAGFGS
jgi:hypothetical protein